MSGGRGGYGERLVDGHKIVKTSNDPNNGYNYKLECECGWRYDYAHLKKDGKLNSWSMKAWEGHLESVAMPDDYMLEIGTVHKARSSKKYYVFTSLNPDVHLWMEQSANWFVNPRNETYWYMGEVTFLKKGDKKKILNRFTERDEAIAYANKQLAKARVDGYETEQVDQSQRPVAMPLSPEESVAYLVTVIDEALASGDVNAMQNAMHKVDKALQMLAVVRAKRVALEQAHNNKLRGLLEIA